MGEQERVAGDIEAAVPTWVREGQGGVRGCRSQGVEGCIGLNGREEGEQLRVGGWGDGETERAEGVGKGQVQLVRIGARHDPQALELRGPQTPFRRQCHRTRAPRQSYDPVTQACSEEPSREC